MSITATDDAKKVIKAQAAVRGFLTRASSNGARVRTQKEARAAAALAVTADGEPVASVPPSPFLPTPHSVVSEMLTLAGVTSTSTVLDIGCGDGRVCLAAAREKGAHGIGFESFEQVYTKAVALCDAAPPDVAARVELHHSDFTAPDNVELERALERADIVFVFLLPTDMPRIVDLTLEAIRRKHARAMAAMAPATETQQPARAVDLPAGASSSADASSATSCPCPSSVRTRIASWTFSLPSVSSALAVPLVPTHSLPLESAHTKLHLYDLCWCSLQQTRLGCSSNDRAGHAQWISRVFNTSAASPKAPSDLSVVDISAVNWGHALNTIPSLLARLEEVRPSGLFIECDLRIRPRALDALASDATTTIDDVIMAHDVGADGPRFTAWYDALQAYHAQHPHQPLGLKLDFKDLRAVAPVLKQLKQYEREGKTIRLTQSPSSSLDAPTTAAPDAPDSAEPARIPSYPFLWLNADILRGPGASGTSATPIDAASFLRTCRRECPGDGAVLSLGWVTGSPVGGFYTHDDISDLLAVVDEHLTCSSAAAGSSSPPQPTLQLTYPLRASLVRRSWQVGSLQRLLAHDASSTLTIWTSRADQMQPHAIDDEAWIRTLPKHRTFLDLVL